MDRTNIDRALRNDNKDLLKSFVYGYGHIAIFAGIAATGVGIELAIKTATEQTLSNRVQIPLFYGIATALIGLTLVHSARAYSLPLPSLFLRLLMAGWAILLSTFSNFLTSAIADLEGRVYSGIMATEKTDGKLYRIDTDGSYHVVADNLLVPNGMDFCADFKHFYLTDSDRRTINFSS